MVAQVLLFFLPRMGLVNVTASVARALEIFNPEIVAMSGICAGLASNAVLGQLLVTDVVWEYQSGKWLAEAFEAEPYQVNIAENTRLTITKMIDDTGLLTSLESGYQGMHRPSRRSEPKLAVFSHWLRSDSERKKG